MSASVPYQGFPKLGGTFGGVVLIIIIQGSGFPKFRVPFVTKGAIMESTIFWSL